MAIPHDDFEIFDFFLISPFRLCDETVRVCLRNISVLF